MMHTARKCVCCCEIDKVKKRVEVILAVLKSMRDSSLCV